MRKCDPIDNKEASSREYYDTPVYCNEMKDEERSLRMTTPMIHSRFRPLLRYTIVK